MASNTLHVYPAVPTRSKQLGDTARIVFVRFIPHGRKSSIDLASLHAHDIEASFREAVRQVLGQRASFQSDLMDRFT
ncbi:hypothetical protein GCM10010924_38600 [Rhizobium wenxiniae]|nr:hypothetical protein GCM10010924_38600 [Rhizobium wenxiniae]